MKSAKISGVRLEYPLPDGTFNVRHMSTDGLAEIRRLDGKADTYPIKKIKYTLSGEKGIKTEMELGEPLFPWTGTCRKSNGGPRISNSPSLRP